HGRALAGPVGPQEPERLAPVDIDVDTVHGDEVAEPFHQPAGADQRLPVAHVDHAAPAVVPGVSPLPLMVATLALRYDITAVVRRAAPSARTRTPSRAPSLHPTGPARTGGGRAAPSSREPGRHRRPGRIDADPGSGEGTAQAGHRAGWFQSASTSSTCSRAARMPSSMPMVGSCSSCSGLSNALTTVILVLPLADSSVTRPCVVPMASTGSPCASANPSSNSSRYGGESSVIRHQPWERSPCGPVMW